MHICNWKESGIYFLSDVVFVPMSKHIFHYLFFLMASGDFANDQCNGHGEMHYADGSFYKGQWVDNRVC